MKKTFHRLGDLQLRILKILWRRQEATVAQVHQDLIKPSKPLAYTTVATMLRKMEDRHLVEHRSEGRTFIYRPMVSADAVSRNLSNHLLDRLFGGSLFDLVSHLLTTRDISPDELRRLEKLIEERKRQR